MAARRAGSSRSVDDLSKKIIQYLKERFIEEGHDSSALIDGYVGVPFSQLTDHVRGVTGASQVDFDLSMKFLDEAELVKTGPMEMYDNPPGSGVFIVGFYSKREYAYLTEAGYRVPTDTASGPSSRARAAQIHISGGTFHQSQIALGEHVAQQQRIENVNDAEIVERLVQLLSTKDAEIDAATKDEIRKLVDAAQNGDTKEAKPIFQKVFGLAAETVKQQAWGILTALITKAMGL